MESTQRTAGDWRHSPCVSKRRSPRPEPGHCRNNGTPSCG